MWKRLSNENLIQRFNESNLASKPVEFNSKGNKEQFVKWQQVIAYNGEYIIF